MLLINKPNGNYTARQLKLPLEIEKLINISDPVYTRDYELYLRIALSPDN